MARLVLALLSLTILSLTYTGLAASFIEDLCQKTSDPKECVKALVEKVPEVCENPPKLAAIALFIAERQSEEASTFLTKESKKPGQGIKEHVAITECLDAMGSAIKLLMKSHDQFSKMVLKDGVHPEEFQSTKKETQTSVDNALGCFVTCDDRFDFTKTESVKILDIKAIKAMLAMAERGASIASDLLNSIE